MLIVLVFGRTLSRNNPLASCLGIRHHQDVGETLGQSGCPLCLCPPGGKVYKVGRLFKATVTVWTIQVLNSRLVLISLSPLTGSSWCLIWTLYASFELFKLTFCIRPSNFAAQARAIFFGSSFFLAMISVSFQFVWLYSNIIDWLSVLSKYQRIFKNVFVGRQQLELDKFQVAPAEVALLLSYGQHLFQDRACQTQVHQMIWYKSNSDHFKWRSLVLPGQAK